MSETEIRRAIEEAKAALPASTGRLRKVALGAALGLGLAALSACYGAPMPRPPANDHGTGLQGSSLTQPDVDNKPAAPTKP